jgi:signal transduction histidine kinase
MEKVKSLVYLTAGLFTLITGFVIYFVVLYRNRQLKNRQEREKQQSDFRQELLKTRIEMQDQTLSRVSREIHDNITQVLSFVKLNLALVNTPDEQQRAEKIAESRELVSQAISDLRDLSKSLSFEHITRQGLVKTIETEVARLNKSGIIRAEVIAEGNIISLGEQRELVLFRIFQESINNALKHAGAKDFKIVLKYIPEMFILTLEDNGKGFSPAAIGQGEGSGLRNIENRAALIGAVATIKSAPGEGCVISINLNPTKKTIDPDGYSNSTG